MVHDMSDTATPRLLAVEDNAETRLLLKHLLQKDFDVTVAASVREAMAAANENVFDLFLLDINLGERLSGMDLLKLLRNLPEAAATPAIAVTAYTRPGDQDQFLSAGFTRYLAKPFSRKDLLHTVHTTLSEGGSSVQSAPGELG